MAAAQYAAYSRPGAQVGAGQGFANQGAGYYPAVGSHAGGSHAAAHLDAASHDDNNRPAGAVAEEAGAGFTGHGTEVAEPIFSDVSDMEPVYTFKSRSSFNRGRATFYRSHYEPAEHPVMPIYQPVYVPAGGNIKTVGQANDQVKGSN